VLQVRLLLRSAQSLSSGSLIFIAALILTLLCESSRLLLLLLLDALSLRLLVCLLLRFGLRLLFCCNLGLLALNLGILCRVPTV
jgi:hypothetical protein